MPACDTTDEIFIVRQLQEKYLVTKKIYTLHLLTWRRLLTGYLKIQCGGKCPSYVLKSWLVKVVQAMYANANHIRVNGTFS